MIIADLNHLEVVTQKAKITGAKGGKLVLVFPAAFATGSADAVAIGSFTVTSSGTFTQAASGLGSSSSSRSLSIAIG